MDSEEQLPIQMLDDRILVLSQAPMDRKSGAGILIPATVKLEHRLAWARVVAVGPNVKLIKIGDSVLYDPKDEAEVELRGQLYLLLRENDLHAIAITRHRRRGRGVSMDTLRDDMGYGSDFTAPTLRQIGRSDPSIL